MIVLGRKTIAVAVLVWVVCTVGLQTAWGLLVHHERFSGTTLLVRLVVFLGMGALLGALAWRLQGRRR